MCLFASAMVSGCGCGRCWFGLLACFEVDVSLRGGLFFGLCLRGGYFGGHVCIFECCDSGFVGLLFRRVCCRWVSLCLLLGCLLELAFWWLLEG